MKHHYTFKELTREAQLRAIHDYIHDCEEIDIKDLSIVDVFDLLRQNDDVYLEDGTYLGEG